MFNYWVIIPDWKVAVCAPPKCASTSVAFTLAKHFYGVKEYVGFSPHNAKKRTEHYRWRMKEDVPKNYKTLAIVRDPVDRFTSLWSHHCRDGVPGGIPKEMRNVVPGKVITDMSALLKFIEAHRNGNPHWCRQAQIIGRHTDVDHYCALEEACLAWDYIMPDGAPVLEYENRTRNPERIVPDSLLKKIHEFYKDDFVLYGRALRENRPWAT